MNDGPVRERQAVRAILLTPDEEVLLIRVQRPEGGVFWVAPGGGIEPGETVEEALRREMLDELALETYQLGPPVWLRHHTFNWAGERLSQHEIYHIVHVDRFEAAMLDEAEAETVTELRWWPVAQFASVPDPVTPLSLAAIVRDFLAHGAPAPLPPEEVLVDWA